MEHILMYFWVLKKRFPKRDWIQSSEVRATERTIDTSLLFIFVRNHFILKITPIQFIPTHIYIIISQLFQQIAKGIKYVLEHSKYFHKEQRCRKREMDPIN